MFITLLRYILQPYANIIDIKFTELVSNLNLQKKIATTNISTVSEFFTFKNLSNLYAAPRLKLTADHLTNASIITLITLLWLEGSTSRFHITLLLVWFIIRGVLRRWTYRQTSSCIGGDPRPKPPAPAPAARTRHNVYKLLSAQELLMLQEQLHPAYMLRAWISKILAHRQVELHETVIKKLNKYLKVEAVTDQEFFFNVPQPKIYNYIRLCFSIPKKNYKLKLVKVGAQLSADPKTKLTEPFFSINRTSHSIFECLPTHVNPLKKFNQQFTPRTLSWSDTKYQITTKNNMSAADSRQFTLTHYTTPDLFANPYRRTSTNPNTLITVFTAEVIHIVDNSSPENNPTVMAFNTVVFNSNRDPQGINIKTHRYIGTETTTSPVKTKATKIFYKPEALTGVSTVHHYDNYSPMRKNRIYIKSRFSRVRQWCRPIVMWTLWLNIVLLFWCNAVFYGFKIKVSYVSGLLVWTSLLFLISPFIKIIQQPEKSNPTIKTVLRYFFKK